MVAPYLPAGQLKHDVAPCEYWPKEQAIQSLSAIEATSEDLPAGQLLHNAVPGNGAYLPWAQPAQLLAPSND